MVSFSCEVCNNTVIKKKLDQHKHRCHGAYFTCIDCSSTFPGNEYRGHTSCISESEKYEKFLHKGPKKQLKSQSVTRNMKETAEYGDSAPNEAEKVLAAAKYSLRANPKPKSGERISKNTTLVNNATGQIPAFTNHVTNSKQSLYKVLKKVSKARNQEVKHILKTLDIYTKNGELIILQNAM